MPQEPDDDFDMSIFLCVDCNFDTFEDDERYMVDSRLWKMSGIDPQGSHLCIGCLEKRLGRQLYPDDFTICLLNRGWHLHSPRLASRILGVEEDKLPSDYMNLVKNLPYH